jgi:hypothetical protein
MMELQRLVVYRNPLNAAVSCVWVLLRNRFQFGCKVS